MQRLALNQYLPVVSFDFRRLSRGPDTSPYEDSPMIGRMWGEKCDDIYATTPRFKAYRASSAIVRTPKRVHNPVFVKLQSDGGHGLNGLDWFRVPQPGYDLSGCVLPLRHSRSFPSKLLHLADCYESRYVSKGTKDWLSRRHL
jgi:hypothetical protein